MQTADWQLLFSDRFTGARNPARLPTKDAIPSNPLRPPFLLLFYHLEVIGDSFFGFAQDFDDCAAVGGRKPGVFPGFIRSRQDLPYSFVNRILSFGRQRVEGLAINHVTAGIAQQPLLQVQVPQTATLAVSRSALSKN